MGSNALVRSYCPDPSALTTGVLQGHLASSMGHMPCSVESGRTYVLSPAEKKGYCSWHSFKPLVFGNSIPGHSRRAPTPLSPHWCTIELYSSHNTAPLQLRSAVSARKIMARSAWVGGAAGYISRVSLAGRQGLAQQPSISR